jgi:long-subunit acyl-CoA synthetase (AMP-forming)
MEDKGERLHQLLSGMESAGVLSPELAAEILRCAEDLLSTSGSQSRKELWQSYLDLTGSSRFLQALPDRSHRYRWADTTFKAIELCPYTLHSLLNSRVRSHPDRPLFRDLESGSDSCWTYADIARRLRILAGLFCRMEADPRVAIFSENSVDTACCDLACLVHEILDTPLNVHLDAPTLSWIFDRLGINLVVTDCDDRARRLVEVLSHTLHPFRILQTGAANPKGFHLENGIEFLDEAAARIELNGLDRLLASRRSGKISQIATVMFTSGSTGIPKGISFTQFHLVAKRFARAAALPAVGNEEVLLSYLPLYHTFGRYLEMLGMLYWGGTYVFAGNASLETLLACMSEVRPTGIISIPLRLAQIRDHCIENMESNLHRSSREAAFRSTVGDRLRWGLSAAGHLDARVFRFFQGMGVDLCSGFGMTEGTGGITMTPPGEYVDDTVGIPLPGVHSRFSRSGELQVSGPYIARYLDEQGYDLPEQYPSEEYWLSTGDLFQESENGYLQIVDRIKDIYKNNRGQTIAPRSIEKKFDGVPGIKRVFLAGDGRDTNVLLIVPEDADPIREMPESDRRAYLDRIVSAANADLAPYERIFNFSVLDRDFSIPKGELTPKGSFRRKQIETHFLDTIERLYIASHIHLHADGIRIKIPRWFYRNLGLLENEIVYASGALRIDRTKKLLTVMPNPEAGSIRIGDLEYQISDPTLDLGWFARQPRLWIGNPELAAFCPCKSGWDLQTPAVLPHVRVPSARMASGQFAGKNLPDTDTGLCRVHRLCSEALFGSRRDAQKAVEALGTELRTAGDLLAQVIRTRLEALAWHPAENVRCLAYQFLLTDEPRQDYGRVFPAFIASGLPFLNEDSIRRIANAGLGDTRLRALRRRLFDYRMQLHWPASPETRNQFVKIFHLLVHFARDNPAFVGPIRSELASWALHRSDPDLAHAAEHHLHNLIRHYRSAMGKTATDSFIGKQAVFDETVPTHAVDALRNTFEDRTFLKQSILLAFGECDLDVQRILDSSLWVTRILSRHPFDLFRVAINPGSGQHYDLLLALGQNFRNPRVRDTIYWLMALSDHPLFPSALPRFGACRPDLKVMTMAFMAELTVWDKIREFGASSLRTYAPRPLDWRRLFVRGMGAFYTAWRSSGSQIVPGAVTPSNVVVPAADFREGSCILSLTEWKPYGGPLDLILSFLQNFYHQTEAYYPHIAAQLSVSWIFDACMESLGLEDGPAFLRATEEDLENRDDRASQELKAALVAYRQTLSEGRYQPLPLLCARHRFQEWEHMNADATAIAREEEVEQLFRLYRLDRYSESVRYLLYRHTYFRKAGRPILKTFDRLLEAMFRKPETRAVQLPELSELQAVLHDPAQREIFSRMIFHRRAPRGLELVAVGKTESKQVMVRTEIEDKQGSRYAVYAPVVPAEIGQLYRLFQDSDYPATVSEEECYFVLADSCARIVGGIRYLFQGKDIAYLNGIVVSGMLKGRGIAGALLEDFCTRMAAIGIGLIKTDFILRRFLTGHGFKIDPRWGGLVRLLRRIDS